MAQFAAAVSIIVVIVRIIQAAPKIANIGNATQDMSANLRRNSDGHRIKMRCINGVLRACGHSEVGA